MLLANADMAASDWVGRARRGVSALSESTVGAAGSSGSFQIWHRHLDLIAAAPVTGDTWPREGKAKGRSAGV